MGDYFARLHSRYNPQLEADRYIEALNPDPAIDYYILIEPGLGYLVSSVHKHCPDSKVVILHADSAAGDSVIRDSDIPMWFQGNGTSVQDFLEKTIPEGASARIIEWRPGLNAYKDIYPALVRESAEFIKRSEASRRTSAAFGRRWAANFFRNLTILQQSLLYNIMDIPIVITGSGPGLESVLPELAAARDGIFILASSSSMQALAFAGISPDMIISTDGGNWAPRHLHACFRREQCESSIILAMTLNAAIPSQFSQVAALPLNDGSLWQNIALHSIGLPSIPVPQRGTVTATALELAMIIGTGSIFLAGMDLAIRDIQSHARPYEFDRLLFDTASRLQPMYSQACIRSGEMKAGGSHDIYAAWFKNRIASWPARIFSLGANHSVLNTLLPHESLQKSSKKKNAQEHFKVIPLNNPSQQRSALAAQAIINALADSQYSKALSAELGSLLFPLEPGVSCAEIAEMIRIMSGSK